MFHKSNPGVKIVVTGCAAESEKHNLENMKEVSYIVRNKDKLIKKNWENLQDNISVKNKINLDFKNLLGKSSNSNIRKFVKFKMVATILVHFVLFLLVEVKVLVKALKTLIMKYLFILIKV